MHMVSVFIRSTGILTNIGPFNSNWRCGVGWGCWVYHKMEMGINPEATAI